MLLVFENISYVLIFLAVFYVITILWQIITGGSIASRLTELIILEILFCLFLMKAIIEASASEFELLSLIQVILSVVFIAFRTYSLGKFMGLIEKISIEFYKSQNNEDIIYEDNKDDTD